MECSSFVRNKFSTKKSLKWHQIRAKYCLKIQGKDIPVNFECEGCKKSVCFKTSLSTPP